MKKMLSLFAVVALLGTSGCFAAGPIGYVFASYQLPGSFQTGETTNPGGSAISGSACAFSVLGVVALGDYSIDAALKAAGAEGKTLKNVTVDGKYFNVLGAYTSFCTIVNAYVAL